MHPALSAAHSAALMGERLHEAELARRLTLADRERPSPPPRMRRLTPWRRD